jgi:hypothetical protein
MHNLPQNCRLLCALVSGGGMSIFATAANKQESSPLSLRDTLFGDLPIDQWTGNGSVAQGFPWSAFVLARARMKRGDRVAAVNNWREVINQPGLESRHYLQAWQFLRENGCPPPADVAKQVLGVVVEVGMPKGLDLLAAYPNYTACYYNFSGRGVVWEHPDSSLDVRIAQLLTVSENVVAQIGSWDRPRPEAPPAGQVRMNFLTPSGLHFGQGSLDVMSRDPIGAQVLYLAGELMRALIDRSR